MPRAPFGVDRAAAMLALRMGFAALLAFSIAAFLHVHNAYWAAMPVWVVAQSSRGLLLERGFFRLLGTIIGAAAGFIMLTVSQEPYLLLAMLGAWVMLGSGLVHVLGGVTSYGALLAGMTAAVVVLPSMHSADNLLPLAIARVECTLIGVLVVTAVTGFFTPAARRQDFYVRVRRLAADAAWFAADAVGGRRADETAAFERRVLAEMSSVDSSAQSMAAGSVEGYRLLRHSTALAASALSLMAAATSLRGRRRRGESVPDDLEPRLRDLAASLRAAEPSESAVTKPWTGRSVWGPEARLHDAGARLIAAEQALFESRGPRDRSQTEAQAQAYRAYFKPHRDWRRAVISGAVAGFATFAAAAIGYASGWPAGELAALGVCIFSMVLCSLPAPRTIAPKLIVGVSVGVLLAIFYRFVLQPHVDGPLSLIVSVAPFIALGALARVTPKTAMPALDANMCFMLGSQAGASAAGAGDILNGSAALMLAAIVVAGTVLLVPDQTDARLRALIASIRRDVSRLLDGPVESASLQWHARTGRRLLRLLLDLQRAGRSAEAPSGLLATLNLGHAIAGLHEHAARYSADTPQARQVSTVLGALRKFPLDPQGAALEALEKGERISDPDIVQTVQDAAGALREGAALLDPGRVEA